MITYKDLKERLNTLSSEQLDMPVRFVGDSKAGVITQMWILEEDYVNPSGDGCEPVSAYENDPEKDEYDMNVVYPKDTVLLVLD